MGQEEKIKSSVMINKATWDRFLKFVYDKHGRTHGGVMAETMRLALEAYMEANSDAG